MCHAEWAHTRTICFHLRVCTRSKAIAGMPWLTKYAAYTSTTPFQHKLLRGYECMNKIKSESEEGAAKGKGVGEPTWNTWSRNFPHLMRCLSSRVSCNILPATKAAKACAISTLFVFVQNVFESLLQFQGSALNYWIYFRNSSSVEVELVNVWRKQSVSLQK